MELSAAILTRRSIRRYLDRPVPPELIDQLLEAATRAPSSHNSQPWRFAVITTSDVKAQLADQMGERLKADRLRAADRIDLIDRDVARSRERIMSAPVVIVACMSIDNTDQHERLQAQQYGEKLARWRRRVVQQRTFGRRRTRRGRRQARGRRIRRQIRGNDLRGQRCARRR